MRLVPQRYGDVEAGRTTSATAALSREPPLDPWDGANSQPDILVPRRALRRYTAASTGLRSCAVLWATCSTGSLALCGSSTPHASMLRVVLL